MTKKILTKNKQAVIFFLIVVTFIMINNILNNFSKSFVPNNSAYVIGIVIYSGYILVMWNEEIVFWLQRLRR